MKPSIALAVQVVDDRRAVAGFLNIEFVGCGAGVVERSTEGVIPSALGDGIGHIAAAIIIVVIFHRQGRFAGDFHIEADIQRRIPGVESGGDCVRKALRTDLVITGRQRIRNIGGGSGQVHKAPGRHRRVPCDGHRLLLGRVGDCLAVAAGYIVLLVGSGSAALLRGVPGNGSRLGRDRFGHGFRASAADVVLLGSRGRLGCSRIGSLIGRCCRYTVRFKQSNQISDIGYFGSHCHLHTICSRYNLSANNDRNYGFVQYIVINKISTFSMRLCCRVCFFDRGNNLSSGSIANITQSVACFYLICISHLFMFHPFISK